MGRKKIRVVVSRAETARLHAKRVSRAVRMTAPAFQVMQAAGRVSVSSYCRCLMVSTRFSNSWARLACCFIEIADVMPPGGGEVRAPIVPPRDEVGVAQPGNGAGVAVELAIADALAFRCFPVCLAFE